MIGHLEEKIKQLKPFHEVDSIPDLYSWTEFENLINLRPFMTSKRVNILNKETYKWDNAHWMLDVNTFPPVIIQDILPNYMGYLTDCSRINSKVNTICAQLDVFTNAASDAHMFFNLVNHNEEQGFGIHSDVSHNLIVQVEGSTRMEVWDIVDKDEIGNIKNIPTDPIIDVTLNPGDLVFVPKRYWHKATSKTKRLSISFPCQPDLDISKIQQRYWINVAKLVG